MKSAAIGAVCSTSLPARRFRPPTHGSTPAGPARVTGRKVCALPGRGRLLRREASVLNRTSSGCVALSTRSGTRSRRSVAFVGGRIWWAMTVRPRRRAGPWRACGVCFASAFSATRRSTRCQEAACQAVNARQSDRNERRSSVNARWQRASAQIRYSQTWSPHPCHSTSRCRQHRKR